MPTWANNMRLLRSDFGCKCLLDKEWNERVLWSKLKARER